MLYVCAFMRVPEFLCGASGPFECLLYDIRLYVCLCRFIATESSPVTSIRRRMVVAFLRSSVRHFVRMAEEVKQLPPAMFVVGAYLRCHDWLFSPSVGLPVYLSFTQQRMNRNNGYQSERESQ